MQKKFLIGCGSIFLIFIVGFIIAASVIWSHRNEAVERKNDIDAQYQNNQSNYDKMWKEFKEIAQVTDMQVEDYKKAYNEILGDDNKKPNLLANMVVQDNPKLNSDVYPQLIRVIESGRSEFHENQKAILDKISKYNTQLDKHIFMNMIFRFEKKDMKDYILLSEKTTKAFETKKDDEIQLKK